LPCFQRIFSFVTRFKAVLAQSHNIFIFSHPKLSLPVKVYHE
jgi:hypothetical protein